MLTDKVHYTFTMCSLLCSALSDSAVCQCCATVLLNSAVLLCCATVLCYSAVVLCYSAVALCCALPLALLCCAMPCRGVLCCESFSSLLNHELSLQSCHLISYFFFSVMFLQRRCVVIVMYHSVSLFVLLKMPNL